MNIICTYQNFSSIQFVSLGFVKVSNDVFLKKKLTNNDSNVSYNYLSISCLVYRFHFICEKIKNELCLPNLERA